MLPPLPPLPKPPPLPMRDSKGFTVAAGADLPPLAKKDAGARVSGNASEGCVQVQCVFDFPPRAVRALMLAAGVRFHGDHECLVPESGLLVTHKSISTPGECVWRWRS